MASNTIKESKLITSLKYLEKEGGLVEIKIHEVPKSMMYPLGYRDSLYYLKYGQVHVGYDNHYPKGPHKHLHCKEYSYDFAGVDQLMKDFFEDKQKCCEEEKN